MPPPIQAWNRKAPGGAHGAAREFWVQSADRRQQCLPARPEAGERRRRRKRLALGEFDAVGEGAATGRRGSAGRPDTPQPRKPDAIFPNNWVSFHFDGTVALYPMLAPNRRSERREEILEQVVREGTFRVAHRRSDTSRGRGKISGGHRQPGAGSAHRVAYACLSPRTDLDVLGEFAQLWIMTVTFEGWDGLAARLSHQRSHGDRHALRGGLRRSHRPCRAPRGRFQQAARSRPRHRRISLRKCRFRRQLWNWRRRAVVIALSTTALQSLTPTQRSMLESHAGLTPGGDSNHRALRGRRGALHAGGNTSAEARGTRWGPRLWCHNWPMLELGVKLVIAYLLGTLLGSLILGRFRGVASQHGKRKRGRHQRPRTQGKLFGFLVLARRYCQGRVGGLVAAGGGTAGYRHRRRPVPRMVDDGLRLRRDRGARLSRMVRFSRRQGGGDRGGCDCGGGTAPDGPLAGELVHRFLLIGICGIGHHAVGCRPCSSPCMYLEPNNVPLLAFARRSLHSSSIPIAATSRACALAREPRTTTMAVSLAGGLNRCLSRCWRMANCTPAVGWPGTVPNRAAVWKGWGGCAGWESRFRLCREPRLQADQWSGIAGCAPPRAQSSAAQQKSLLAPAGVAIRSRFDQYAPARRPHRRSEGSADVCMSELQHAGRGRLGRRWIAPFGSRRLDRS